MPWHSKLGSFYKDQLNSKNGFIQHVSQTISKPKQWLLDYIDEGNPKPSPPTEEQLKHDAIWAEFLAPVNECEKADYTYQPLDSTSSHLSTRLVRLLPGDGLENIQLVIENVDLDSCGSYEALSYCWGDPSIKTSIHCTDGSLQVTKNLKSALLHLRKKTKERVIWIDAVCINQQDLKERSQQVGIMRDIYRKADETIVWLGEERENSNLGIELCEKLYAFFDEGWEDLEGPDHEVLFNYRTPRAGNLQDPFNPAYAQTDEGDFKNAGKGGKGSEEMEEELNAGGVEKRKPLHMNPPHVYELLALRDLASRQWFRRTWITQELALASKATMICGHRSISWEAFIFGFTLTFVNGRSTSGGMSEERNFIGALLQIRDWVQHVQAGDIKYEHEVRMLDLLRDCRMFEATDPRDKVFGLLGIAPQESSSGVGSIRVDYSRSVEDVYGDVARLILSSSGNLDLLSVPQSTSELGKRLPSWVPDWSHTSSSRLDLMFPTFQRQSIPQFAASRGSISTPRFEDPNILVLSGYVVDSITQLSEIIEPPIVDSLKKQLLSQKLDDEEAVLEAEGLATMSKYFDVMISIEDMALSNPNSNSPGSENQYPTKELLTHAFFRTLCTSIPPNDLDSIEQAFSSFQTALKSPRTLKKLHLNNFPGIYNYLAAVGYGITDIINNKDGAGPEVFQDLMKPAFYCRFAVTGLGYFALVPAGAEVGDEIGVFKGGRVPVVVRRGDEDGCWRVVGESYVHGIMYGEGFDEGRCGEVGFM